MFFLTKVLLILTYKYILVVLIILEIMIINVSMIMFNLFRILNIEFYLIYYLVFRVCERVLGVTLLVIVVRFIGNEYYYSFNISKF